MHMVNFTVYSLLLLVITIELLAFVYIFEHVMCIYIYKQVPFVMTPKITQKLLVKEIQKHYSKAKLICEIGSGYGIMARFIAKKTGAKVIALENMPISAFFSKVADLFQKNSKTIKCNAFDYLDKTKQTFDIGIAYLSPHDSNKLLKYKNKIKTLITLDFAIDNMTPTQIINVGHGYTYYNHKPYPHKIYIYKLQ